MVGLVRVSTPSVRGSWLLSWLHHALDERQLPPTWSVGHRGNATRDNGNGMTHPLVRSLADTGPMLPTLVDEVAGRAGWTFEPKWDGWRCLAIVDDAAVDLRSRRA